MLASNVTSSAHAKNAKTAIMKTIKWISKFMKVKGRKTIKTDKCLKE
jgi:hypothetical protein